MTSVAVMFLTYAPSMDSPRVQYARTCMYRLLQNLTFREGELSFHIADDGSPEEHSLYLQNMVVQAEYACSVSITEHMGYGGNYNRATQVIHPLVDIVLPVEDDWELIKPFDLSDLAMALAHSYADHGELSPEYIGCIRLGYLGWTDTLSGKLVQTAGQTFLRFDNDTAEKHVFAGHPRLETVGYERAVGAWPEGIQAGYTELEVGKRAAARMGVAWPLDADINASQDYCRLFAHIGETQA